MVEKISIEIGLDGGEEVQRQLDGVEKAGVKTFTNIQSAAEQLDFSAISDGFQKVGDTGVQAFDKVKVAAENAVVFEKVIQGINKVEGAFNTLGNAVEKMATRMTRSLGPFGVLARALGPVGIALGVVGGAFIKFSNDSEKSLAALTGEAAKLDLTAQQLDKLQTALGRLGVPPDALNDLQKLKQSLEGVSSIGFDPIKGEFIKADVINRLQQVIEQLEKMPDGLQRTQLAMKLLGDSLGSQVIAGLQTGTISAKNFADALGLAAPATQEQIVKAQQYQQSIEQMKAAWTELKTTLAAPILIPAFELIRDEINNIKNDLLGIAQTWLTVKSAIAVGQVLFSGMGTEEQAAAIKKIRDEYQQAIQKLQELQTKAASTGQTLQQTGQAGAQAGQQGASGFQVWDEALGRAVPKAEQLAQAVQQAGQAGTQAGQQGASGFQVWDEALGRAVPMAEQLAQAVQQTGEAGAQAGQQVATGMQSANQALSGTATQANTAAQAVQQVKAPDASGWTTWGQTVISALQNAIDKLLEFIGLKQRAGGSPVGGGAPIGGAGGGIGRNAVGGLLGGRGTGTSDSNLAWVSRGEHIMPARVVRQPGVLALLEALRRGGGIPGFAAGGTVGGGGGGSSPVLKAIERIGELVSDAVGSAATALKQMHDATLEGMRGAAQAVKDSLTSVIETLAGVSQTLIDALEGVGSTQRESLDRIIESLSGTIEKIQDIYRAAQEAGRKARGGLLGGRGTGTSDSNLAWVSRGEYITPARAVAQPGVLAFLEALRRSGGDLSRVLDGMGRFALGGMVPRAIPAFATGGLAGGGHHVTIQFPGLPAISGLRASSDVVDQLHRAAALAQVRSGGRKPSRYS